MGQKEIVHKYNRSRTRENTEINVNLSVSNFTAAMNSCWQHFTDLFEWNTLKWHYKHNPLVWKLQMRKVIEEEEEAASLPHFTYNSLHSHCCYSWTSLWVADTLFYVPVFPLFFSSSIIPFPKPPRNYSTVVHMVSPITMFNIWIT